MGAKPKAGKKATGRRAGLITLAVLALGAVALVGLAALANWQQEASSVQDTAGFGEGDVFAASFTADEQADVAQGDNQEAGVVGTAESEGSALDALLLPIQEFMAGLATAFQ
ncbi:MAG: hypothetical protein EPO32_01390 [Anaerolineae bacterium]|nr:MAG: hypothetical protein EPO32_01390 [Anaerolineae bacterium]